MRACLDCGGRISVESTARCRPCGFVFRKSNAMSESEKTRKRKNMPSLQRGASAARMREWRERNPERNAELADKHRETRLAAQRRWRFRNREKMRAACAEYAAMKFRAVPPWADLEDIKRIYRRCPEGLEVDHIVPLKGRNVCGLHVSNNLQYLTRAQNMSKANKWPYFSEIVRRYLLESLRC